MRKIYLVLAILFTILMVFTSFNTNMLMDLSLKCINCSIETSFQIISVFVFIIGVLTGILYMLNILELKDAKNNKYKNKLEKASVGIDESVLKIKVLENKIKTLEVALDKALKKGN